MVTLSVLWGYTEITLWYPEITLRILEGLFGYSRITFRVLCDHFGLTFRANLGILLGHFEGTLKVLCGYPAVTLRVLWG